MHHGANHLLNNGSWTSLQFDYVRISLTVSQSCSLEIKVLSLFIRT
jgi:hypothetical protein